MEVFNTYSTQQNNLYGKHYTVKEMILKTQKSLRRVMNCNKH